MKNTVHSLQCLFYFVWYIQAVAFSGFLKICIKSLEDRLMA